MRVLSSATLRLPMQRDAFRVLDEFEAVDAAIEAMKALTLDADEELAFAKTALALRYGERSEGQPPAPVTSSSWSGRAAPKTSDTACGPPFSASRRTSCVAGSPDAARRVDASAPARSPESIAV